MTTLRSSAQSADTCLDRALQFARSNFDIADWRPLQAQAVSADLAGLDSLVVQGTGCGKSLCFQMPALMRSGMTLVISPLIALMKDQIDGLQKKGLPAATLNSTVHHRAEHEVFHSAIEGRLRLLYVSPERAVQPAFLTFLSKIHAAGRLMSVVIDEAHCIAQWGHDFRPAYRSLGSLRVMFPDVPIHCFTATARAQVREQIVQMLGLRNPAVLVGGFDRPELALAVHCGRRVDRDVVDEVAELSAKHGHGLAHAPSGIVYCITRAETERIAELLRDSGVRAAAYHAGMDDRDRTMVQERFLCNSADPDEPCVDVAVATIAFGMGINKPDVRFVIHWGMPSCLEVYHQEIGRAARDGKPADCVMFADPRADADQWRLLFEAGSQEKGCVGSGCIPPGKLTALCAMQEFAEIEIVCRHDALCEYFNDSTVRDSNKFCWACDNCQRLHDSHASHNSHGVRDIA